MVVEESWIKCTTDSIGWHQVSGILKSNNFFWKLIFSTRQQTRVFYAQEEQVYGRHQRLIQHLEKLFHCQPLLALRDHRVLVRIDHLSVCFHWGNKTRLGRSRFSTLIIAIL
jgi:hypothetical protein